MAPTKEQRKAAIDMVSSCDAVIADSSHLAKIASQWSAKVRWIADNVRTDLISQEATFKFHSGGRLPVFWCGESIKLYDLLMIKDVLLEFTDMFQINIITSSMEDLIKWPGSLRNDFDKLLAGISHQITPFQSIENLMEEYSKGGVFISPRYLDNSYNLGHTEWKITLPMACGLVVLCSDQQSYKDVQGRSGGRGIRVCATADDWRRSFREVLHPDFPWEIEQQAAISVVRKFYATPVICQQHTEFLKEIIDD